MRPNTTPLYSSPLAHSTLLGDQDADTIASLDQNRPRHTPGPRSLGSIDEASSDKSEDYDQDFKDFDDQEEDNQNDIKTSIENPSASASDPDSSSKNSRSIRGLPRKASFTKSVPGPVLGRKDNLRMGSPLRHVTQIGPSLPASIDDAKANINPQLTPADHDPIQKRDSQSTKHRVLPTSTLLTGLGIHSAPSLLSGPSSTHPIVSSRRRSILNPLATATHQNPGQSQLSNSSLHSITSSTSAPATSMTEKISASPTNTHFTGFSNPEIPPRLHHEIDSRYKPSHTSRASSASSAGAFVKQTHISRPSQPHASPSLVATSPPQFSPIATDSPSLLSLYSPIPNLPTSSYQHQQPHSTHHARQSSIASSSANQSSTGSITSPTRRHSLIFTTSANSASPTKPTYQANKSALSTALANNATSAPPHPPIEAIKLQRVPTSVRIAQDLRLPNCPYGSSSSTPVTTTASNAFLPIPGFSNSTSKTISAPAVIPGRGNGLTTSLPTSLLSSACPTSKAVGAHPEGSSQIAAVPISSSPLDLNSASSEVSAQRAHLMPESKSGSSLSSSGGGLPHGLQQEFVVPSSWSSSSFSGTSAGGGGCGERPRINTGPVPSSLAIAPSLASPINFPSPPGPSASTAPDNTSTSSSLGSGKMSFSPFFLPHHHGSSPSTSSQLVLASLGGGSGTPGSSPSVLLAGGDHGICNRDRSTSLFTTVSEDGPYTGRGIRSGGAVTTSGGHAPSATVGETAGSSSRHSDDLSISSFSGGVVASGSGSGAGRPGEFEPSRRSFGQPASSRQHQQFDRLSVDHLLVGEKSSRTFSNSVASASTDHKKQRGIGSLDNNRTSIAATGSRGGPSTEDFAKIIIQSRDAKVQKWKPQHILKQRTGVEGSPRQALVGVGSTQLHHHRSLGEPPRSGNRSKKTAGSHNFSTRPGSQFLHPSHPGLSELDGFGNSTASPDPMTSAPLQRPYPLQRSSSTKTIGTTTNFQQQQYFKDLGSSVNPHVLNSLASVQDAQNGESGGRHGQAGQQGQGHIEWVDWLDDYKRMKEAKVRAELLEDKQAATKKEDADEGIGEKDQPEAVMKGEHTMLDNVLPSLPKSENSFLQNRGVISVAPSEACSQNPHLSPDNLTIADSLPVPASEPDYLVPPSPPVTIDQTRRLSVSSIIGRTSKPDAGLGSTSYTMSPRRASSGNRRVTPQNGEGSSSSKLPGSPSLSGFKVKKNFNLGKKIDEWWNAVRSSFTLNNFDDKLASSSDTSSNYRPNYGWQSTGKRNSRRLSVSPFRTDHDNTERTFCKPGGAAAGLRSVVSAIDILGNSKAQRTSQIQPVIQNTRLTPSVQSELPHLMPPQQVQVTQFPQAPPSGALAPVPRLTVRNRTPSANSGSSQGSEGSPTRPPSERRRNPHLTLKLDPLTSSQASNVFNRLPEAETSGISLLRHPTSNPEKSLQPSKPSSTAAVSATTNSVIFSTEQQRAQDMGFLPSHIQPEPTPVLSPTGSRLWDKTPALVLGNPFKSRTSSVSNPPELNNSPRELPLGSSGGASSTTASLQPAHHKPMAATTTTLGRQQQQNTSQSSSATQDHHSHTPTFSMNTIRAHIRHRLATAKTACDNSLRVIVDEITAFVENEARGLREQDRIQLEQALASQSGWNELDPDQEILNRTSTTPVSSPALPGLFRTLSNPSDLAQAPPLSNLHHRSGSIQSSSEASSAATSAPVSRRESARGGVLRGRLRRPSVVLRRGGLVASGSSHLGRVLDSPIRTSTGTRSVSVSTQYSESVGEAASSRSTSRSRSPLPQLSSDERFYRSAFVEALQEMSSLATELLDIPIGSLTGRSHACVEVIYRVQVLGRKWDEHTEWPHRPWYVRVLLAVAGLSRVLEWWDAEKGFWNFEPEEEEEDGQEIMFFATRPGPPSLPQQPQLGQDRDNIEVLEEVPVADLPPPAKELGSPVIDLKEDFQTAISLARTETILAEVGIADATILYLSSGWTKVTGLDPQSVVGLPFGELIDGNYELFNEANRRLLEDAGNTVELQFTVKISLESNGGDDDLEDSRTRTKDHFMPMTGKGMLMMDRVTGEALHSMWVIRLNPRQREQAQAEEKGSTMMDQRGLLSHHSRCKSDPVAAVPPPAPLSTEPLLCRICEHYLPAYYFERHNETCAETHRLEMQVSECNDRLSELKDVIKQLRLGLERGGPEPLSFDGIPLQTAHLPLMIATASSSTTPATHLSPLNPGRCSVSTPASTLAQQHQSTLRAGQRAALDEIEKLVNIALDISTPSSNEEITEANIDTLRLLSPNSESNLSKVTNWRQMSWAAEDRALVLLGEEVWEAVREKSDAVNRMRNTILYAERIRMEWEVRANQQAAATAKIEQSPSVSPAAAMEPCLRSASEPRRGGEAVELPRRTKSAQGLNHHELHLASVPALRSGDSKGLGVLHGSVGGTTGGAGTPPRSPRYTPGSLSSRRESAANSKVEATPLSPRIPSAVPGKTKTGASIKDFDMLKPISKGAFGQVWLAKKKTTGDYYAIKILKKQDMIAKNQIMNVKSERKILMNQADSDFVVKLFYTFSSRDHLYLVMEYLNGGDCAALVKALGNLPEEWTRNYVAEVVMGLEYLHSTGVVHRDLKPDNLLIDHRGHLKLTDFGLSKIGLLGRQAAEPRSTFFSSHAPRRRAGAGFSSVTSSPDLSPMGPHSSYFLSRQDGVAQAEHTPSESSKDSDAQHYRRFQRSATVFQGPRSSSAYPGKSDVGHKNCVGTPDYLAPESILGIGMDEMVDWWALGVVCYEFLYGIPPFHDSTPDKVFDRILSRRLEFPESDDEISAEAIDFMDRLMCTDPKQRLGSNGAAEVKAHPFLAKIDWSNLFKSEASFVPSVTDPESTDYFDPRGAAQVFHDDDEPGPVPAIPPFPAFLNPEPPQQLGSRGGEAYKQVTTSSPAAVTRSGRGSDDFGTFNFKNLPVLERANEEVIRKLKGDQAASHEQARRQPRHLSLSGKAGGGSAGVDVGGGGPSSPTDSTNSSGLSLAAKIIGHGRRPSEQFNRILCGEAFEDPSRRNSLPSRMRRASFSGGTELVVRLTATANIPVAGSTVSSPGQPFKPLPSGSLPSEVAPAKIQERTVDCLIAEDNPISSKVLETILIRFGCRCVVVPNGAEAISCAMGDVTFDVIFMDLMMPIIEGQDAARMIKSTQNLNARTPIVAVTSFESFRASSEEGTLFAALLGKPVEKKDVLDVMKRLGFCARQTKKKAA